MPGEVAYPVPPLAIPPEGPDDAARDRAARPRSGCSWTACLGRPGGVGQEPGAAPVAVMAGICRELDGLPLAIELAAARASTLSVEEIEAHLSDRFRFLAYRRPAADPRHQALKAAIDWSYDLLPAAEQRVFRAAFGVRRRLRAGAGGRGVQRRR